MPKMKRIGMVAVLLLAGAAPGRADVWDTQAQNDNSIGTENELVHGSDQLHDLAPVGGQQDLDFYRLGQRPYSSWEVIVDATSADIGTPTGGVLLQRMDSNGSTILQSALPVTSTINFSQSLRWQNPTNSTVVNQYVKVLSNSCTTQCNADDVYRLRALETTYSIPRFNNGGSQLTFVMIQNTAPYQVNGNLWFWTSAGAHVATYSFSLAAKSLLVLNTSTVPTITPPPATLAGQSGSITITNNGRYGDLVGKAVATETSSGFTFDTPMVPRPN